MNPCKTEQEYIDQIYLAAQKACARYGYLPSVLIGQACIENGYGIPDYWDNPQISLLIKYWNMVGIKSELLNKSWTDIGLSVWDGQSLTKKTPEVYGGKQVIITDNFRKYHSAEESFVDFLLFLTWASNYGPGGTPKYGREVLDIKDPEKLITEVNRRGYTTGTTYPTSVMKIIRKHNLTKYDNITGIQPTDMIPPAMKDKKEEPSMDITINKKYLTTNNSYSTNNPIAIVIHNTDNFAPTADAKAHAEWLYSDTNTGMSWHYAVDDHSIYQCLPHNRGAFHVGKNYGTNNLYNQYGGRDHKNTIGIEMCVNQGYDYEKAFQNTVKLTKYLMKELNIPADRVFQHWHICSKDCPSQIRKRGDWDRFKQLISGGDVPTPTADYITIGATGEKVKELQTMLTGCGYTCGGIDGIFGKKTSAALKAFKKANGMLENDHYGAKTEEKLKRVYAEMQKNFATRFLSTLDNVINVTAKQEHWIYDDSHSLPPCADHKCSCDRSPSRALYDMGYTDQREGGETCGTLPDWLPAHGWTKITDRKKIKPGAIVAVRKKEHNYIDHVFVVKKYYPNTDRCDKYDTGSTERIQAKQPYMNVPLVEWSDRVFVCAWNPPSSGGDTPSTSDRVWNGVDYKSVYAYSYYRKKYPDLQKAFGNDKAKYFEHFCNYGMKEGRQGRSSFDVKKYKERYADLRKKFGNDLPKYYEHYCVYGKKEGRKGN